MKRIFFSSLVLAAGVLMGADLTTKSGKVYKDYSVIGATSRGVTVAYAEGAVSIPLADLPDALREKYSGEVAKKKAAAQKKADARKRTAALKRITFVLSGQIECIQVLPKRNAFLANHGGYDTIFCITDVNTSNMVDGSILKGNRIATEFWRNPVSQQVTKREKEWVHVLYCTGQYQYTTTSGASKTIPRFTLNKERALKYLEDHPNAGLVGISMNPAYGYILPEYSVGTFGVGQK